MPNTGDEYMLGQAGVDCEEQRQITVSALVFEINSTESGYPTTSRNKEVVSQPIRSKSKLNCG